MEDRKTCPVSVMRRLLRSVALLMLLVGPAEAQIHGNHAQQPSDHSTKGASIDDFVKILSSDDPAKRLEAVKSLGTSKDRKAIGYLIGALGDSDVRVQAKAIQMLGDMRAVTAARADVIAEGRSLG